MRQLMKNRRRYRLGEQTQINEETLMQEMQNQMMSGFEMSLEYLEE
jgi:hypothetical protein